MESPELVASVARVEERVAEREVDGHAAQWIDGIDARSSRDDRFGQRDIASIHGHHRWGAGTGVH